jgi:hypothetical protein
MKTTKTALTWIVIVVVALASIVVPATANAQSGALVLVTGVASCRSGASAAGATLYLHGIAGYVYNGGGFRLLGYANSSGTISYAGYALRTVYIGPNGARGIRVILPC